MVVRRRLRRILYPLLLYVISGSVSGYFLWHAIHGGRGLEAKLEYRKTITDLSKELESLQGEKAAWERRIARMRDESIDRDLLKEEAYEMIGRVHKNEALIFLNPSLSP